MYPAKRDKRDWYKKGWSKQDVSADGTNTVLLASEASVSETLECTEVRRKSKRGGTLTTTKRHRPTRHNERPGYKLRC